MDIGASPQSLYNGALTYNVVVLGDGPSQVARVEKNPPANAGDARDAGSIPGSGRSPGEGNGNPLQ